jgi:hypothetical protein
MISAIALTAAVDNIVSGGVALVLAPPGSRSTGSEELIGAELRHSRERAC